MKIEYLNTLWDDHYNLISEYKKNNNSNDLEKAFEIKKDATLKVVATVMFPININFQNNRREFRKTIFVSKYPAVHLCTKMFIKSFNNNDTQKIQVDIFNFLFNLHIDFSIRLLQENKLYKFEKYFNPKVSFGQAQNDYLNSLRLSFYCYHLFLVFKPENNFIKSNYFFI